jgi:hypothetical protein
MSKSSEVGTALGERDVVPGRFCELDAGQPAQVELDAADRASKEALVGEVGVLEARVDCIIDCGRRLRVWIWGRRVRGLWCRQGVRHLRCLTP